MRVKKHEGKWEKKTFKKQLIIDALNIAPWMYIAFTLKKGLRLDAQQKNQVKERNNKFTERHKKEKPKKLNCNQEKEELLR